MKNLICEICQEQIQSHQTKSKDEDGNPIHARCGGIEQEEIDVIQERITDLQTRIKIVEEKLHKQNTG